MSKFSDLTSAQKSAVQELLVVALQRRIKEEIDYTNQVFRLLLLGNGSAIALLTAFMGAVGAYGHPISQLTGPLWKFLLGAVFGALIYFVLMTVTAQATVHQANQAFKIIRNDMELDEIQGWGLSHIGLWVVRILALLSLAMFAWGASECISIVGNLPASSSGIESAMISRTDFEPETLAHFLEAAGYYPVP